MKEELEKYVNDEDIPFINKYYYWITNKSLKVLEELIECYKLEAIINDTKCYISKCTKMSGHEGKIEIWYYGSSDRKYYSCFETLYNEIDIEKIKVIETYNNFKNNPIDKFLLNNYIEKEKNDNIEDYIIDYWRIIDILFNKHLVGCSASNNSFYGIEDNKTLLWVSGYDNNKLKDKRTPLDSAIYGYCGQELLDHLLKLYKENSKVMIVNDNGVIIGYNNRFNMAFSNYETINYYGNINGILHDR